MLRRPEGALAITEENRDVRRARVRDDEVGIAVTIHIRHSDVAWSFAARKRGTWRGSEILISIIEQHADAGVVAISDDQVGLTVAIDVGDGNEGGPFSDRKHSRVELRRGVLCGSRCWGKRDEDCQCREQECCFHIVPPFSESHIKTERERQVLTAECSQLLCAAGEDYVLLLNSRRTLTAFFRMPEAEFVPDRRKGVPIAVDSLLSRHC
jgi:hypothetical protein